MDLGLFLGALEAVRPSGVRIRDWSLYATRRTRLSLGIKDRQAGNVHAPLEVSESLAARYLLVWEDGLVSRGTLERRQLQEDPEGALRAARAGAYDDPDGSHVLGPATFPDVCLYDEDAARMAAGDADELGRRLGAIRDRIARHGLRTWSGSFSASAAVSRLVTSAGLDVSGRGTTAGWHATLDGELGDGFSARALEPAEAFEDRLDRLVQMVRLLHGDASSRGPGLCSVILHPGVVEEYVLDTLLHNLDGSSVSHGESAFGRQDFGSDRAVLRDDLCLSVDPLVPFKLGSYRFSTDGVPAAPCAYIEAGRLRTPILDLKYARRLGLPPTAIPFGMDALAFSGSAAISLEQALERASGGVLVLNVLGVHTQDASSGDFSLSTPQVLGISGAALSGRLRGTLSGNLFDLLRSPDTDFVTFEGDQTPGLLVRCRFQGQ